MTPETPAFSQSKGHHGALRRLFRRFFHRNEARNAEYWRERARASERLLESLTIQIGRQEMEILHLRRQARRS